MEVVDRVLLDVAQALYSVVPFDIAAIGEEVSAILQPGKDPTPSRLLSGGIVLSPTLFDRLLPDGEWERLPTGLRWRPWSGDITS